MHNDLTASGVTTISASTCYASAGHWISDNEYKDLVAKAKLAEKAFPEGIVDVIYNDPATIIHWSDKTKTVVQAQEGDKYDPEKGFLFAVAKRAFGNDNSFNKVMKKWCNPENIAEITAKRAEKKLKKANAVKHQPNLQAKKSVTLITEFVPGDTVVCIDNCEDNIEYEPRIGTIGRVVRVCEHDVLVHWPDYSCREFEDKGLCEWYIHKGCVRRLTP